METTRKNAASSLAQSGSEKNSTPDFYIQSSFEDLLLKFTLLMLYYKVQAGKFFKCRGLVIPTIA